MAKRNAQPEPAAAKVIWQNRITRYGEQAPGELVANERNWRTHPRAQQDALEGALRKVGIVQNVVVNQRSGRMLDGHLRVQMAINTGHPFYARGCQQRRRSRQPVRTMSARMKL